MHLRRTLILLSLASLPVALVVAPSGAMATPQATHTMRQNTNVTTSSLGQAAPTFVGPAATGCAAAGCSLLTGPFATPSTASLAVTGPDTAKHALGGQDLRGGQLPAQRLPRSEAEVRAAQLRLAHMRAGQAAQASAVPAVNCQPLGPGCDRISAHNGGALGVKGLNAVDSATQSTNVLGQDLEPSDQGLCAGNGYVVESDNLGEILIFNTRLNRVSQVIPLDTVMGLTGRGWSSGGDIGCVFDYGDGGHFIFTEFVSASSEASGGPFSGCFAAVANTCFEGIAVTDGANPFGPYHTYFLNANYNQAEPGAPFLLNDFTKIGVTRDTFELFYDEFPLSASAPGIGGGGFNGAQEFAIDKHALEEGLPVSEPDGSPNRDFNVAIENMGLLATPDGTCASDNKFHLAGITCWFSVIPTQPPDPTQYDNSHGGSGFMLDTLDFYGQGDNRIAAFDWTGLSALNSPGCSACAAVKFGGQLFSGVNGYFSQGASAPQKAGPIPLGAECGAAGLSTGTPAPASCPEGGIATNGDNFTQAVQAQNQLWGGINTEVSQNFASGPEVHQAAAYYVVGTRGFDLTGTFTLTSQGYVSAAHEDLEFPSMAAGGSLSQDGGDGTAVIAFSLEGNGGPTGADGGGFFPSTAFGRVTSDSGGLLGSTIAIADLGQAPQDGFTEYLGFPGPLRPRWGDYTAATFVPGLIGHVVFSTGYIQSPNCTGAAFTLTLATCGGTRDAQANWGTSVNSVIP